MIALAIFFVGFVLFCVGNEISKITDILREIRDELRKRK